MNLIEDINNIILNFNSELVDTINANPSDFFRENILKNDMESIINEEIEQLSKIDLLCEVYYLINKIYEQNKVNIFLDAPKENHLKKFNEEFLQFCCNYYNDITIENIIGNYIKKDLFPLFELLYEDIKKTYIDTSSKDFDIDLKSEFIEFLLYEADQGINFIKLLLLKFLFKNESINTDITSTMNEVFHEISDTNNLKLDDIKQMFSRYLSAFYSKIIVNVNKKGLKNIFNEEESYNNFKNDCNNYRGTFNS